MLKSPTPSSAQLTTMLRLATGSLLLFVVAPVWSACVTDRVELPLFETPNADAEVLGFIPAGTQVRRVERRGDFAQVVTDDDKEGWLALEHLSETPVGATREVELSSLNEALNAELKALRAEVERLKNDLLDVEQARKRQIHAISRSTENEIEALRHKLEALRVVRTSTQPGANGASSDATEVTRLQTELKQLRAEQEQQGAGRIPSEALREMERLANKSLAAKEKLAQSESRALQSCEGCCTSAGCKRQSTNQYPWQSGTVALDTTGRSRSADVWCWHSLVRLLRT
jgi:SH3 domain protein